MNEQIKRDNISLLHRTDGDGMEQEKQINDHDASNVKQIKIIKHSIKHFKQINLNELNLKYLKPKLIKINTNINKYNNNNKSVNYNKFKETSVRFIPKEPFKGAVTPLTVNYYLKQQQQHSIKKYKKNNIDIQVLVSQMCNLATAELKIKDNNNDKNKILLNSNCLTTNTDSNLDSNSLLLNEIKELKNKNDLLEEQLGFQIKVNGELKTLLVASLGEDLEARVQDLTNDKLELARALLSSTEHLTSHREQLEYLAGHSEVWRSKFLASSLMVDELAKYKLELTTLINELKECIKLLLQESNDITLLINNIYYLLLKIINKLNINYNITTNHFNIIDLLNHIQTLITTIGLHLFKNNFNTTTIQQQQQQQQQIQTNVVNINTNAEIKSQQVLIKTNKILQQDGGTSDGNNSGSNNTTTTTNTTDHTNTMIYQLLINNKIKQQQQQQQINTQCCIHCNHNK